MRARRYQVEGQGLRLVYSGILCKLYCGFIWTWCVAFDLECVFCCGQVAVAGSFVFWFIVRVSRGQGFSSRRSRLFFLHEAVLVPLCLLHFWVVRVSSGVP